MTLPNGPVRWLASKWPAVCAPGRKKAFAFVALVIALAVAGHPVTPTSQEDVANSEQAWKASAALSPGLVRKLRDALRAGGSALVLRYRPHSIREDATFGGEWGETQLDPHDKSADEIPASVVCLPSGGETRSTLYVSGTVLEVRALAGPPVATQLGVVMERLVLPDRRRRRAEAASRFPRLSPLSHVPLGSSRLFLVLMRSGKPRLLDGDFYGPLDEGGPDWLPQLIDAINGDARKVSLPSPKPWLNYLALVELADRQELKPGHFARLIRARPAEETSKLLDEMRDARLLPQDRCGPAFTAALCDALRAPGKEKAVAKFLANYLLMDRTSSPSRIDHLRLWREAVGVRGRVARQHADEATLTALDELIKVSAP